MSDEGQALVEYLRTSAPEKEKAARAFDFIHGAVELSMDHHFVQPLAALRVGALTRKALSVSLNLAVNGMKTPMRRILNGMDSAQLSGVADAIEERLYPDPHG